MSGHEVPALWETALEGPDTDNLAAEIVILARIWAEDDADRLREAARILAQTPYLEGER